MIIFIKWGALLGVEGHGGLPIKEGNWLIKRVDFAMPNLIKH